MSSTSQSSDGRGSGGYADASPADACTKCLGYAAQSWFFDGIISTRGEGEGRVAYAGPVPCSRSHSGKG